MGRRGYAGGAVVTTLAADLTSGATSGTISSATGWPDGSGGKPFLVSVKRAQAGEEKILVVSRSGTTISWTDTTFRGQDGSSPASHLAGDSIEVVGGAQDLDEANAHNNDDVTTAHAASKVSFAPTGAIAATTVQAALAELDTEKSGTAHTHLASFRGGRWTGFAQSIPNNTTDVPLTFASEEKDTSGFWSPGANAHKLIIPADLGGMYLVVANVSFNEAGVSSAGQRQAYIAHVDAASGGLGWQTIGFEESQATFNAVNPTSMSLSGIDEFVVGDWVEIRVWHNRGSALPMSFYNVALVYLGT